MDILERIVEHKRKEVAERKELYPVRLLEQSIYFESPTVSLKKYIQRPDKSGIIAEIKRKSPSKGVINNNVSIERTSIGYMQAGASALSVLTDKEFFDGSNQDLTTARKFNFCPILRKDFTIDEYQIIEAKSIGADAILLIAAVLTTEEIRAFAKTAHRLGLEVLLEVHSQVELHRSVNDQVDLVGVNNRNLKTFELDLNTSRQLVDAIPKQFVKVSESGIESPRTIMELKQLGFQGFLMGQNFMQHSRPEEAAKEFIEQLKKYSSTEN
ncbi:MAG: indole-3-glycerol phosphate synthase TrpC [Flammeovirgaceae bacterium]